MEIQSTSELSASNGAVTHTPTPWHLDYDDRPGMDWNIHVVDGSNPDNRICFMTSDGPSELNALHIVKCVNERPALIALLEDARNALASIQVATTDGSVCDDVAWYSQGETLHDYCDAQVSRIDAALKGVRG